MTELTGMTRDELVSWVKELGYPAFRGNQIFRWIHQGRDFNEMSNLPLSMRVALNETAVAQPITIRLQRVSSLDGTVKFLFALRDGNCIEGVLMQYKYGLTLCISTQVGCRMGCRFCASTLEGLVRNLSAGEMLGEILAVNRWVEENGKIERISHVVLMGSGEPLDNYDQVIRFLKLLKEEDGVRIGLRNVSLSTCGLVPMIYRLADENLPVTLCISLHAPNDEARKRIMPVAEAYSIADILKACRAMIQKNGRRIIFEYALSEGENSSEKDAAELADLLRGMQCHVNLIPLNPVPERGMKGVDEETVARFMKVLEKKHISVTRRREMGDDIEGACGQLRRKTMNDTATGD